MENASKALIIAGSILISIVIISLGIMVVNNARQTVSSANLSESEINTFNSKFSSYCGQNKTANEISSLFDAIISNNAAERQAGTLRYVTVTYGGATYGTDGAAIAKPIVPANRTYTLTATYGDAGIITTITIT